MAIVSVSILTILARKLPEALYFQGEEAYITLDRCNSLPSMSIIQLIPLQNSLSPLPWIPVCTPSKKAYISSLLQSKISYSKENMKAETLKLKLQPGILKGYAIKMYYWPFSLLYFLRSLPRIHGNPSRRLLLFSTRSSLPSNRHVGPRGTLPLPQR